MFVVLCSFAFVGGGGDINVHADAACDICVFLLIFFCFRGGAVRDGRWAGDVNVHADAACHIRLCFSSCFFLSCKRNSPLDQAAARSHMFRTINT